MIQLGQYRCFHSRLRRLQGPIQFGTGGQTVTSTAEELADRIHIHRFFRAK